MVQIGTDSGLMPQPVRRSRDPARPGRAGRGDRRLRRRSRGETVELRSGPRHDGRNGHGARPYVGAADAVPGRRGARARPDPGAAPAAPAARLDQAASRRKPDHTWTITIGGLFKTDLADQRPDLQPGLRRRLPEAGHDRDLGDPQPDQRRPPDAPAPHRLVPARARRQAAAALGRLPQGHLLRLSRTNGSSSPATSPTTPASSSSTATCSTTRTTA